MMRQLNNSTGFWPVLLLSCLIIVAESDLRSKGGLLLIGCGLLMLLNLVRLLSLFWVGVDAPAYFALAHSVLWPLAMISAILGLWFVLCQGGGSRLRAKSQFTPILGRFRRLLTWVVFRQAPDRSL